MSYTNRTNDGIACDACVPTLPEPTMADVMKEVSCLAEQNHLLIHRIRSFLTGVSEDQNERAQEPRSFREELLKARYEVFRTNEELGSLAVELGLP